MAMSQPYLPSSMTRAEADQLTAPTVLDFGTNWCGHCQAAQRLVDQAFATLQHSSKQVQHVKIEDGNGRPLGRSYRVTLWPTLIFLRDGREIARVVRPPDSATVELALAQLVA